jgi:hypothetical protein
MINSKSYTQQTNSEIVVLTDAELDSINGGNWLGNAVRAVGHFISSALHGSGDLRRSVDRPN